jgi:hypothetical protein
MRKNRFTNRKECYLEKAFEMRKEGKECIPDIVHNINIDGGKLLGFWKDKTYSVVDTDRLFSDEIYADNLWYCIYFDDKE